MKDSTSTKMKICYESIQLFSEKGYNNCGIREIAKAVGIKSSSIYKHFSSKQEILLLILNMFEEFFHKYRYRVSEILEVAEKKPLVDVLQMCFHIKDRTHIRIWLNSLTIIISLRYEMDFVKKTYHKIFLEDYQIFLNEVMEGLVKMKKIKDIDYKWINYMLSTSVIMTLHDILDKDYVYEEKFYKIDEIVDSAVKFLVETYAL